MPISPLEYLRHILDETEYLISERKGINKEQFFRDATIKRAFVRSIEIIGEAARRISQTFRQDHPDIPWRKIIAQRNVLVHEYDNVAIEELWRVATARIPELIRALKPLIPPFPPEINE